MKPPTCYVCHSPNDLSIRSTHRGRKIYMCKSCRRMEYASREDLRVEPTFDTEAWSKRFLENHRRLLKHAGNVRVPVREVVL